ncbi:SANT domain DNA binding protein [Macrophomina phaseolina MS6]|uniref:SANT domain DNA binding protein n=1 Tax=Macrophomina phaseolina (strain MS6) TaxID=1126212 RepID=K2R9S7_MACPH|nr:SANT domain DNA binding protein [Macrophomina phaseolina MS6]
MGRKISESRAERLDGAAVRIKASMTSEGLLQHDRCWIVHYSTQGGVSSASAGILDIQERRLGTFKSSGPDGSSGHSRRFCPHHIFCLKKKSKRKKEMVSKKRYVEKEEQLLRDLKSEYPGKSWEAIAELYNARIGDKSRLRTGLALQMKYKKMQAREKRPAKKALGERGKQEVLSVEERMHQSRTAASPLPGAEFPLNEQCVTTNWATTSLSLSEPREDVEYEISLLQVSEARVGSGDRLTARSVASGDYAGRALFGNSFCSR